MGFGVVDIKVGDERVTLNVDEELEICDVSSEMDRVAAQQAWWGDVWASAEAQKIKVDAYYRTWRAEVGRKVLEKDPKMAEWKVKQIVESDPVFKKMKEGLAIATRNAILCKAIQMSFSSKAAMLQSKGAMLRSELDSTGMHTKRKTKTSSGDTDDAKRAMKKIFKGKKKK